ncbi:MAG: hypothetical protein AAGB05_16930 [Pseudomonadota bacterium]
MTRALWVIALIALVVGLFYRGYPLVAGDTALAEVFMTEDGYLMLTVARNMAIGLGMSVSEGTIPTNGVQPLATFLFAGAYGAAGGDKVAGLVGVHLIALAASVGAAAAMWVLARRVLRALGYAPVWAWVATAFFFTGPLLIRHAMNGLETGLYTLAVLLVLLVLGRVLSQGREVSLPLALTIGAVCGVAFLARNDAVFLVLSAFTVWGLFLLIGVRMPFGRLAARVGPAALVCLAVIAPWLIHNQLGFGSIVPISGTAQSTTAGYGANADLLPAVLFEHMWPMLPIPSGLERDTPVVLGTAAVLVPVLAWFAWRVARAGTGLRLVLLAYALHAGALAYYYGFHFGAPHFLSRYLAPVAPLLILAAVVAVLDLARAVGRARGAQVAAGAALAAFALLAALLVFFATPAQREQGHFQVVRWVDENVDAVIWVGAVQTGTLGYWHDRTINLDGKVNPEALAERLRIGTVLDYVTKSEIDVLADWQGIAGWIEEERFGFAEAFELVVNDPEQNLAVFRRRPE